MIGTTVEMMFKSFALDSKVVISTVEDEDNKLTVTILPVVLSMCLLPLIICVVASGEVTSSVVVDRTDVASSGAVDRTDVSSSGADGVSAG